MSSYLEQGREGTKKNGVGRLYCIGFYYNVQLSISSSEHFNLIVFFNNAMLIKKGLLRTSL